MTEEQTDELRRHFQPKRRPIGNAHPQVIARALAKVSRAAQRGIGVSLDRGEVNGLVSVLKHRPKKARTNTDLPSKTPVNLREKAGPRPAGTDRGPNIQQGV